MIYFDAILTLELVSVSKSLQFSDSNFSVATGWENIAVLQMHPPFSLCLRLPPTAIFLSWAREILVQLGFEGGRSRNTENEIGDFLVRFDHCCSHIFG